MAQFLLTEYGNERVLQAIAQGTTVEVYAMVYGDGGGYQYTPQRTQTNLVNQLGIITSLEKRYDNNDGFIYFSGVILANAEPCTIRELGLIDASNKLLAVGVIPDTIKPEEEEGLEVSLPISMGFKTSVGEVMTVYIDVGDVIATKDWVGDNFATIDLDNLSDNGIKVINDYIIEATEPLANKDLSNLTEEGNGKLHYSPYSLISGNTLNGSADILYAPGTGTQDVVISDPTSCSVNPVGTNTQTITFSSPKTLLAVSAVCQSWPNENGSVLSSITAILGDDTEVLLGQSYTSFTGRLDTVQVNYTFSSPTVVKALKLSVTVSGWGSGYVGNVSYTERVSVSTADTLYFNIGGGNYPELKAINANEVFKISSVPSVDISDYSNGYYNIFIDKTGVPALLNNTFSWQQERPYFINKVGNLTINNGIISNFSTSNYATLPSNFSPSSFPWSIVYKITTGIDVSIEQFINSATNYGFGSVDLAIKNSKFMINLSSTSSAWDIANETTGSYTVQTNTDYWVKLEFTGTQYILSYSLDGETYTPDITVANSTSIYQNVNFMLGCDYTGTEFTGPFLGSIDLKESYININDQRWWSGNASQGDVWLDYSKEPLQAYQYDGYQWNAFSGVYIGAVNISGGVITDVYQPDFNSNSYNIKNTKDDRREVISWCMPDYKNGYRLPSQAIDVWYTADRDLMVIAGQANNTNLNILIKDDNGNIIPSGYYGRVGNVVGLNNAACNIQAWVPKGYSYMITSGNSTGISIFVYPLKGAN